LANKVKSKVLDPPVKTPNINEDILKQAFFSIDFSEVFMLWVSNWSFLLTGLQVLFCYLILVEVRE